MLKDKKIVKYIIAIALCFVLLFVGIFSVSAWEFVDDEEIGQTSFGDFVLKNIKVSVTDMSDIDLIDYIISSKVETYEGGVRLDIRLVGDLVSGYTYNVSIQMRVPYYVLESNDLFLGSYDLCLRRNGKYTIKDVFASYRYGGNVGQQNSKWRITTFDSFPTVKVIYDKQTIGNQYEYYYTNFSFTTTDNTDQLYFYLFNYDMELQNPNADIIDNNNANTSAVQSSISATQSAITQNNNSNTSKVQSSISATQSAITSNNNSNTSKVQSSISKTESNLSSSISKTESNIASDISKTEQAIKENQDKNTQSQIENDNRLQQKEQDDANNKGASGVGEVGEVIPNDSDGFIKSLGNLVTALNYSGTDCDWELPSVSLPKISGVMPSIKLWDKMEIPFEYWISKIPSSIMTLIRSILTIALIVYCFKELYSIISYVLTLKGGGASE